MLLKQIIDVFELLDDSRVDGAAVVDFLKAIDPEVDADTYPLTGPRGTTHMVKVRIPGARGKKRGRHCADPGHPGPSGRHRCPS